MRLALATALLLAGMAGSARAMPPAPVTAQPNATIIEVAGGCGAGWHRGPYGGCLRNYANPDAHACPRGYHVGPNGGCKGNGK